MSRFNYLSTEATEAELARARSSMADLLAIAVEDGRAEWFGSCADSSKHKDNIEALRERQKELFERLNKTLTLEDLDTAARDTEGRPKIRS